MSEVTRILSALDAGDPCAADQLLPVVYGELRRLAAARLAHEPPGQTLQATALVHEAYLRLVGSSGGNDWDDRGHFFAAAAEAMRRILVDNARRKQTVKHGGHLQRHDADRIDPPAGVRDEELLVLNEALDVLAAEHPRKAEVVKLRYFVGLTNAEAAAALGISVATVDRDWAYAKAWLHREVFADQRTGNAANS
jgi:RNA polymerase sigma factor (TIGR02999 family)